MLYQIYLNVMLAASSLLASAMYPEEQVISAGIVPNVFDLEKVDFDRTIDPGVLVA